MEKKYIKMQKKIKSLEDKVDDLESTIHSILPYLNPSINMGFGVNDDIKNEINLVFNKNVGKLSGPPGPPGPPGKDGTRIYLDMQGGAAEALPLGWSSKIDPASERRYYINPEGTSTWTKPSPPKKVHSIQIDEVEEKIYYTTIDNIQSPKPITFLNEAIEKINAASKE